MTKARTTSAPRLGKRSNLPFVGTVVGAAALAGSLASDPEGTWYDGLDKPDWQPPGAAFPVVWTALYATIAGTCTAVLNELERRGDATGARAFRAAFVRNQALNGAWSWVFFRKHDLPLSALGAAILAASSIGLARRAGRVDPKYGALLAPYALWTSFATVLATEVWRRNSE